MTQVIRRGRQALRLSAFSLLLVIGIPGYAETPIIDDDFRAYLQRAIEQADSFTDEYAAEVWLVDMSQRLSRYVKDEADRLKMLRLVHKEATRTKLDPELILALIHVESLFDQYAISSAGARGLMQIMPFWRKEIGRKNDNLTDLETNIRYGTTILSYYLKIEKGNLSRALARYNGSLGKLWYPERVMVRWERYWMTQ